jgi:hypothetical protein
LLTWNPICLLNFHIFIRREHAVYLSIGSPRGKIYLLIDRLFKSYRLTRDEEPETREEPRSHKVNAVFIYILFLALLFRFSCPLTNLCLIEIQ